MKKVYIDFIVHPNQKHKSPDEPLNVSKVDKTLRMAPASLGRDQGVLETEPIKLKVQSSRDLWF